MSNGWRLVPNEATDEMLDAVTKNYKQSPTRPDKWREFYRRQWRILLAAAPAVLGPVQRQVWPGAESNAPVGWRYVPSDVWGDQVLTQDPKAADLARQYGRDVEALYTATQLLAAVAAERERCAKLCEDSAEILGAAADLKGIALACADAIRRIGPNVVLTGAQKPSSKKPPAV